jgi:hypothetical protein
MAGSPVTSPVFSGPALPRVAAPVIFTDRDLRTKDKAKGALRGGASAVTAATVEAIVEVTVAALACPQSAAASPAAASPAAAASPTVRNATLIYLSIVIRQRCGEAPNRQGYIGFRYIG